MHVFVTFTGEEIHRWCTNCSPDLDLRHVFRSHVGRLLRNLLLVRNLSMLLVVSAFRDRGVPKPTSEVSPRAPAQMGRREAEREGGK
jgi:hypothetical protein